MGDKGTAGKTPWWDSRITPEIPLKHTQMTQAEYVRHCQEELAPMPPCPHCGESRQDHLWQLLGEVRCDECGQHYKDEPMSIWEALDELEKTKITPLRADIDRWMEDIEKRGDETSENEAIIAKQGAIIAEQGERLDRLEADSRGHEAIHACVSPLESVWRARLNSRVARLEAFKARVIAAVPSVGEATQETEEGDDGND